MKIFLYIFCIIILYQCNKINKHKKKEVETTKNISVLNIKGSKLTKKNISLNDCIALENNELRDDFTFLNTNLVYYDINKVNINELNNLKYYRSFLVSIPFLNFLPDDLDDHNFKFKKYYRKIENYGDCYIGEFTFLNKINSRQNKAYVSLNTSRNEITIWYYDHIEFDKSNIILIYGTKGKNSYYRVYYSKECNAFIPLE